MSLCREATMSSSNQKLPPKEAGIFKKVVVRSTDVARVVCTEEELHLGLYRGDMHSDIKGADAGHLLGYTLLSSYITSPIPRL